MEPSVLPSPVVRPNITLSTTDRCLPSTSVGVFTASDNPSNMVPITTVALGGKTVLAMLNAP